MTIIELAPECLKLLQESIPAGQSVTMTDATEMVFGSSGRGSHRAVLLIEFLARQGHVRIHNVGKRNRRVSVTPTAA